MLARAPASNPGELIRDVLPNAPTLLSYAPGTVWARSGGGREIGIILPRFSKLRAKGKPLLADTCGFYMQAFSQLHKSRHGTETAQTGVHLYKHSIQSTE